MFNSSNIKLNFNENLEKSNPYLYLSQYVMSPFCFKTNNNNNDFRDFDLNTDFFQNSYLRSKNKNPFLLNKEMSQKRDLFSNNNFNFEKYTNSRTKLKQISSNFNEILNNNQKLNPFNFDIIANIMSPILYELET